jgi:ribosomal protein S18 acetylase RimI-like enzyme
MTASETLTRAFVSDPMFTQVQPFGPRRQRGLPILFRACLRDAAHRGGIAWTREAVVAWKPMRYLHQDPIEQFLRGYFAIPFHLGLKATLLLQAHETWCHARLSEHAPANAAYIYCVGVEPSHTGRGIGSQLMNHALDRFAEQGLPCALRTEQPRNVRFYEKLGFRCVEDTIVPVTQLRSWFFVKPPTG